MAYEAKPNTGSLFKNDKKTTDQHPNAKGSALIGGKEFWISSWTNIVQGGERQGEKYQSLKFEPKEKQELPQAATQSPRRAPEQDDDGIPW